MPTPAENAMATTMTGPTAGGPEVARRSLTRITPIAILGRGDLGWLLREGDEERKAARARIGPVAARVLDHLGLCGASFFGDLVRSCGYMPTQIEDAVGWGLDTSAETLIATLEAPALSVDKLKELCAQVKGPVLVIHGDEDALVPLARERAGRHTAPLKPVDHDRNGHQLCQPTKQGRGFVDRVVALPGPSTVSRSASEPHSGVQ